MKTLEYEYFCFAFVRGPVKMLFIIGFQACSFILSSPDVLQYADLYSSLLKVLGLGYQVPHPLKSSNPNVQSSTYLMLGQPHSSPVESSLSYTGICGVQYTLTIVWR